MPANKEIVWFFSIVLGAILPYDTKAIVSSKLQVCSS
jgi:hypothetical protein